MVGSMYGVDMYYFRSMDTLETKSEVGYHVVYTMVCVYYSWCVDGIGGGMCWLLIRGVVRCMVIWGVIVYEMLYGVGYDVDVGCVYVVGCVWLGGQCVHECVVVWYNMLISVY